MCRWPTTVGYCARPRQAGRVVEAPFVYVAPEGCPLGSPNPASRRSPAPGWWWRRWPAPRRDTAPTTPDDSAPGRHGMAGRGARRRRGTRRLGHRTHHRRPRFGSGASAFAVGAARRDPRHSVTGAGVAGRGGRGPVGRPRRAARRGVRRVHRVRSPGGQGRHHLPGDSRGAPRRLDRDARQRRAHRHRLSTPTGRSCSAAGLRSGDPIGQDIGVGTLR